MPPLASSIPVTGALNTALGSAYDSVSPTINAAFDRIKKRGQSQGTVYGDFPTDYSDGQIETQRGLSLGGARGNLANALGSYSAKDYFGTKDFNRNMELARLTGELNEPSILSQVLGGISGIAAPAGQAYRGYRSRMPSASPSDESYFDDLEG